MAMNAHGEWFLRSLRGVTPTGNFELFRRHIHTVLCQIRPVCASLVEVTHGAGPVSLVVAAIDLLGGQAQTHHHWLRGLEHYGDSSIALKLEQKGDRASRVVPEGVGRQNSTNERVALISAPRTFFPGRKKVQHHLHPS